uniref:Uncharacterized protein n=1 Tax=Anguilla anguilla TaxID=7936 RepID=A0A0E9RZD4_ANGAN
MESPLTPVDYKLLITKLQTTAVSTQQSTERESN